MFNSESRSIPEVRMYVYDEFIEVSVLVHVVQPQIRTTIFFYYCCIASVFFTFELFMNCLLLNIKSASYFDEGMCP